MYVKNRAPSLPPGYSKVYLSLRETRVLGMDAPIGDPFGGPAYGEKNGPVAAIALPVLGMAGSYAAFAAATTTLGAVMAGAAFVGSTMSLVGNLTGNAKLSKFGSVLGMVGGLGMGVDALVSGGNFTFSGGEAGSGPEWLQSTQGKLGMTPQTGVTAPVDQVRAEMSTSAQALEPAQSMAANNLNAPGAAGLNAPGGAAPSLNMAPVNDSMLNAANMTNDPLGSLVQQTNNFAGAPGAPAAAGAAAPGTAGKFLDFANKNPLVTMMGFQAMGGLSEYLSGVPDAEIDALRAQVGYADARALQIQEAIEIEKQRRMNLNQGYQQVNASLPTNPSANIQPPWQQQSPGLIASNMPGQG